MIAAGLATTIAGGLPIDAPASDAFSWPALGRVAGVPVPIVLAAVSVLVLYVLLSIPGSGAAGTSPAPIPRPPGSPASMSPRGRFSAIVVAGAFCAVTAIILTSRVASGPAEPRAEPAFETIAACAIGGIPLAGRPGPGLTGRLRRR